MNRYKSIALTIIVLAMVLIMVGFAEVKQNRKVITDIEIRIDDQNENYFISESDVLKLMNTDLILKGTKYQEISLKELEKRIESNRFVHSAEIYKDLTGKLNVNVIQNRPIARIIQPLGPHAYINNDGSILPVSERFTARLPIISGEMAEYLIKHGLQEGDRPEALMEFLKFIESEPFWKAQIAQIDIGRDWEMILYPQVSKQYIEFGKPEDLKAKFKKLKIFYTRILPQQGWNNYVRVNVKYRN